MKKNYVQKIFLGIMLLCFMLNLFACQSNSYRYETQDIDYYFELKKKNPFGYRFLPDEIDENTLERFSYIDYLGETGNDDLLLSLRYLEENAFEEALLNFKENVYSEYHIVEQENLFKAGYTSIFMVGAKNVEPDPSLEMAWLERYTKGEISCYWDMILYSRTDKVIIFNSIIYDNYIGEEFGHLPYIEDVLGIRIKDIPSFTVNSQGVVTHTS